MIQISPHSYRDPGPLAESRRARHQRGHPGPATGRLGPWIANSGSDATVAYEVEVTGNIAHGCSCLAGLNDDPVCKHRAAFYLLIGALSMEPEPEPPAPAVAPVVCFRCRGTEPGCPVCASAGMAASRASGRLVAAADRLAA